jgi:hypothetical protein
MFRQKGSRVPKTDYESILFDMLAFVDTEIDSADPEFQENFERAEQYRAEGYRVRITRSHPIMARAHEFVPRQALCARLVRDGPHYRYAYLVKGEQDGHP